MQEVYVDKGGDPMSEEWQELNLAITVTLPVSEIVHFVRWFDSQKRLGRIKSKKDQTGLKIANAMRPLVERELL